MAYKKLIKVSNVCQLLDKSKYRVTATYQGITFMNNDDGSWTVVGTAPDDPINHAYVEYSILTFDKAFTTKHFIPGHKIIVGGGKVENAAWVQWVLSWSGGYTASNSSNVNSYTIIEYPENFSANFIELRVQKGQTVNFTFKPQFFDLTEMYGAGNEPTTVEQFRQDFPDEMYDYSPHCWLTSYKRVFMTGEGNYLTSYKRNLTCKTKNLFDINSANVTIKDDGSFVSKAEHTSHFYSLNVTPGQIYTVSYYATSRGSIDSGLNLSIQTGDYYTDGVQLFIRINSGKPDAYFKGTFTIPEGATKITFSCLMGSSSYKNFMIELGDTATDYVPYGHL